MVADERLTSALEVDSTAVELSAVLHGGSRQELDDELRSLLAIGKPNVTYMNDAWPTIYENVDRVPDLPFWKFYSQFVTRPFPDEAIDLVVRYMANTPARRATSSARASAGPCGTLRPVGRRSRIVTRCSTTSRARPGTPPR
jgi:hypothetical protein